MQEDKLLSRIDAMETQLSFYMNKSTRDQDDGNEVEKLKEQLAEAQNERHQYEMTAKVRINSNLTK